MQQCKLRVMKKNYFVINKTSICLKDLAMLVADKCGMHSMKNKIWIDFRNRLDFLLLMIL